MADVPILESTATESIVGLRQTPDVVIACSLRITIADRDLVIENFVGVVPHALQPIKPKLGFISEVQAILRYPSGSHLIGEIANPDQHHGDGSRAAQGPRAR